MFLVLFRKVLLCLAGALPVAGHAVDAPVLTLDAAVQRAVGQSGLVEAGRLQGRAARDMAVAAEQLPDPVLKLGINNLPINGEDRFNLTRDFMTMRVVGVMQEFTRSDKRMARRDRLNKEAEAFETTRAMNQAKVQRSAAMAWLDRYYQERVLALLLRQRNEALLQIEAAEAAYRGGRGAQSDVFAAHSALAQLDDRTAQTERQLATAKTQLLRWVGDVAALPLADAPAMDAVGLANIKDIKDIKDSHLAAELLHHPEIAVMRKQEEVALADVQQAQANRQADWSAEVMFSQRGPAYSKMLSLNLSVPLQWDQKNRQDRELSAKQATLAQVQAEREDVERTHVVEIRSMVQEWESNHARLRRYDEAILPLTAERTQAALATYRGGALVGGSLNAVLEARRAQVDALIERLRLEMETARLWAALTYMTPVSAP